MKRVLVAIPYKLTLPAALHRRMYDLASALPDGNPEYELDIRFMPNQITLPGGGDPFSAHAMARNMILDKYLNGHDLVMWIDADLVDYPPDIITRLDSANPGGVTAPIVLIEGCPQFYDTYGYRQNGKSVNWMPPYFKPFGKLVDMDEVGCAYLIPADVYHFYKYETTPGHTEHASIMRACGLKIACLTDMVIYHADLPKYGEAFHGH